jgi:hypothetical protein
MSLDAMVVARRAYRDQPLVGEDRAVLGGHGPSPYWWWIPMGRAGGRDDGIVCAAITALLLGFLGTAAYGVRALNTMDQREEHANLTLTGAQVAGANTIRNRYVRYYSIQSNLAATAAALCLLITLAAIVAIASYAMGRRWPLAQALRVMSWCAMGVAGITTLMLCHWLSWEAFDRRANRREAIAMGV